MERGGIQTRTVICTSEIVVVASAFISATEDTCSSTHATCIKHVAVAVTLAFSDARTATHTALVEHVTIAVTIAFRDVSTSTLVDGTRTVQHAAFVRA